MGANLATLVLGRHGGSGILGLKRGPTRRLMSAIKGRFECRCSWGVMVLGLLLYEDPFGWDSTILVPSVSDKPYDRSVRDRSFLIRSKSKRLQLSPKFFSDQAPTDFDQSRPISIGVEQSHRSYSIGSDGRLIRNLSYSIRFEVENSNHRQKIFPTKLLSISAWLRRNCWNRQSCSSLNNYI